MHFEYKVKKEWHMKYTEQMEEALWQKWSDYDTDAEYASTIEFLNSEDGFRFLR